MQGIVFDIKRFAIHDGPGTRTTVFLKGCPLSCWWCHNPESISPNIELFQIEERLGTEVFINNKSIGKPYTMQQIVDEVQKDRLFMDESGGGVTLSGGEPLWQYDFTLALLKQFKNIGIHTCLDTTGLTALENIKQVAVLTDLFLFDFKLFTLLNHQKYCGVSNIQIKKNLEWLIKSGYNVVVRIPVIPEVNFMNEEQVLMLNYLTALQSINFKEIHLLPYHKIGKSKYERFQKTDKMKAIDELNSNQLKPLARAYGEKGFTTIIH